MKLHDLRPAVGAHTRRTRVGRGIAAGGGKTAGRGTKGQKARAGASIPAWFEGGQTPLHQRIPKLRGFKNPFKTEYEIVNLGRIAALVELGALEPGEPPGTAKSDAPAKPAPITINQELLRAVGAVRTLDKPLKVLGHGQIDRPLFVVADAFSRSAVAKIEAAGGSVQVIEIPSGPLEALGVEPRAASNDDAPAKPTAAARRAARRDAEEAADDAPPAKPVKAATAAPTAKPTLGAKTANEPVRRATAAPSLGSPDPARADEPDAGSADEPAAKPALGAKAANEPVRRATAAPSLGSPGRARADGSAAEAETEPGSSVPSADAPAGEDA
jgi:large subunit ribosomal protein L15